MRLWVCLLTLGACFSPQPFTGAPCPDGVCPSGQRCVEQVCTIGVSNPTDDAGVPDGDQPVIDSGTDGSPPDTAPATWTLVNTNDDNDANVTMPATTDGNLIVVAVEHDGRPVSAVSDNAGNTYTAITGSLAKNDQEGFAVELWYTIATAPGATLITSTAPMVFATVAWEVAGIAKTNTIDVVSKLDDQATTNQPFGAPVTTTADGDFIVSIVIVQNIITGIVNGNGFTNDHVTFGNGWAHLTSATAPAGMYQARWNATNGVSCASTVAFRRE